MHLKPADGRAARAAKEREERPIPKKIKEAAEKHGWEIHSINSFWTRLRKDGVSIEFSYNLRRETKGRAYRRDVVLVALFSSQRDIIEYMAKS